MYVTTFGSYLLNTWSTPRTLSMVPTEMRWTHKILISLTIFKEFIKM